LLAFINPDISKGPTSVFACSNSSPNDASATPRHRVRDAPKEGQNNHPEKIPYPVFFTFSEVGSSSGRVFFQSNSYPQNLFKIRTHRTTIIVECDVFTGAILNHYPTHLVALEVTIQ